MRETGWTHGLIVKHKPIPGGYSCEELYATPDLGASLWKAVDWEEKGAIRAL